MLVAFGALFGCCVFCCLVLLSLVMRIVNGFGLFVCRLVVFVVVGCCCLLGLCVVCSFLCKVRHLLLRVVVYGCVCLCVVAGCTLLLL